MRIKIFLLVLLAFTLAGCGIEREELVDVNLPQGNELVDPNTPDELNAEDEIEDKEVYAEMIKMEEEEIRQKERAQIDKDYQLVRELENLEEKKKSGDAARGSCNAIKESSTCLEYVGSFWTKTQMQNNCSDSGIFELKTCPSGSIGGCNIGNGGPTDLVSWFYPTGGSPIDGDSLKYAKLACDSNPLGRWINSK